MIECKLEKGALLIEDWTTCASPESHSLVDGDGTYTFSVKQTDAAGNTSPVATDTYDLDATAPETTIDAGPSGIVQTPDVTFEFSTDDPTAGFECNLDDTGFTPCTSPMDITGLSDGGHVFDVRAVDPVGNEDPSPAAARSSSTPALRWSRRSKRPPSPSNDDTPSWDLTGEAGATFECKLEKGGDRPLGLAQLWLAGDVHDDRRGRHVHLVRQPDRSGGEPFTGRNERLRLRHRGSRCTDAS